MEQKAQAGLEYLMTYGWALIVIAIVVGVLVFIISSPASNVTFNSSDPTKIMLKAGNIDGSGNVEAIAQNTTGGEIQVTGFQLTGGLSGSKLNGVERTAITVPSPLIVPAGSELHFTEILYVGSGSVDGTINIQYTDFAGLSRSATITANGIASSAGSSVTQCGTNINQAGTYVLTEELSGCSGNGVTVSADNVVINLNNKTITGSGSSYGIELNGVNNVIVTNSNLTNFARGFNVVNSSNITLNNNTANYNTQKGFYFNNSTGISFNSNTACCSGQHDVYCEQAGVTLSGTSNVSNARYQCLADDSGCAAAGIICS